MPHSSTRFMIDFGDQWASALYNSVQFIYLGAVLGYTGVVILQHRSRLTTRASSIGFTTFALGCFTGMLLVLDVLGMNTTHVLGLSAPLRFLQELYSPTFFTVMTLLTVGLAIPAVTRLVILNWRGRRTSALIRELAPLWKRVVMGSGLPSAASDDDPEMHLHRMLVEIEDAQFRSQGGLQLTETETQHLLAAHAHLAIPGDLPQVAAR